MAYYYPTEDTITQLIQGATTFADNTNSIQYPTNDVSSTQETMEFITKISEGEKVNEVDNTMGPILSQSDNAQPEESQLYQEVPQEISYTPIEYPWESNSVLDSLNEGNIRKSLTEYEEVSSLVYPSLGSIEPEVVDQNQNWASNTAEQDTYYQSFPLNNAVDTNTDTEPDNSYQYEEDVYEMQAVQNSYSENTILSHVSSIIPSILSYDSTIKYTPADNTFTQPQSQPQPLPTEKVAAAAIPMKPTAEEAVQPKEIPQRKPESPINKESNNIQSPAQDPTKNNIPPPRPQRKPLTTAENSLPQPDNIPPPAAAAQQPEGHYPISLPPGSDLGALGQIGIFESSSPSPSEGLQSILFWVCILSLFFTLNNNGRHGN
ncbi:hypothetical protein F4703DRAFT_1945071 [Phycomyces blakesleeanus]